MPVERARPPIGPLVAKKDAIVAVWLARTLAAYPELTRRFLAQEQDPFRNPVGQTLKVALAALVDELLGAMDAGSLTTRLDSIVRIRAVQDFTAGEAVAFIFLLKQVIREQGGDERPEEPDGPGLTAVERRIDEMAALASDLFLRCREQLDEVKANAARRTTSVRERMRQRASPGP